MAAGSRRHSGSLPLCFSSHCAERAFPLRAKKREAFFFVACYCRKRDASPYLSALLGQVSNGFSGGKKLVACFLKSKPLILKSGPLIFYLLLYWINALKISFHFFALGMSVFKGCFFVLYMSVSEWQRAGRKSYFLCCAVVGGNNQAVGHVDCAVGLGG